MEKENNTCLDCEHCTISGAHHWSSETPGYMDYDCAKDHFQRDEFSKDNIKQDIQKAETCKDFKPEQ